MSKYIPYIVIVVLLIALVFSLTNRKESVKEVVVSDTTFIPSIDTVFLEKPILRTEKVIDTIYINKDSFNEIAIPLTQKTYISDNYQAWVSGYRPNLDSIRLFNKNTTQIITNTVTKEIYPKKTDIFWNVGCMRVGNTFSPNTGVMLKFKNNMTIGGQVGYYDKNIYYSLNLGYKINK